MNVPILNPDIIEKLKTVLSGFPLAYGELDRLEQAGYNVDIQREQLKLREEKIKKILGVYNK